MKAAIMNNLVQAVVWEEIHLVIIVLTLDLIIILIV